MSKKIADLSEKLLIIFYAICIIPFLILHFYNHPWAEDMYFPFDTLSEGFIGAQYNYYLYWSGRFFSYAILSVNPLIFKSITAFRIACLASSMLLIFMLFFSISAYTKKFLSLTNRWVLCLSVSFLFFYAMPSIGDGIYWFTAVMIYVLGIILMLAFTILIKYYLTIGPSLKKKIILLVLGFNLLAIAGTGEINAMLMCSVLLCFIIFKLFTDRTNISLFICLLMISAIGLAISAASPAHSQRAAFFASTQNTHDLSFSLSYSFSYTLKKFYIWLTQTPLITVSLFSLSVLSFSSRRSQQPNSHFKRPWFLFIFSMLSLFSLCALSTFISAWTLGRSIPRTENIMCFTFLIFWFITLYSSTFLLREKEFFKKFEKLQPVFAVLTILSLLMNNNITTAYNDLVRGNAKRFSLQLDARYEMIKQDSNAVVAVDGIKNIPASYSFGDVSTDTANWYNKWYGRYFGKKSIRLKE